MAYRRQIAAKAAIAMPVARFFAALR